MPHTSLIFIYLSLEVKTFTQTLLNYHRDFSICDPYVLVVCERLMNRNNLFDNC